MADTLTFQQVTYADLPGWTGDDLGEALQAFLVSAGALVTRGGVGDQPGVLSEIIQRAQVLTSGAHGAEARCFFADNFVPNRLVHTGHPGFVTGYYEPVLPGSRVRTPSFPVPLFRRPPDLINLVSEASRATPVTPLTHLRRTPSGNVPYATRTEIEHGALDGQGLELFWLADPVDAFFLQVQGSGLIEFADGTSARVTYDGKNGHPYTSAGKVLIERGIMTAEDMSLDTLARWLRADLVRAAAIMRENKSFVFFRELTSGEARAPQGVLGKPLIALRSLAIDPAYHTLGLPVYVSAPTLPGEGGKKGFHRLMIAHDVGSAIKGPERGDIYYGSGAAAGVRAGTTKHACNFYALKPKGPAL
jgi:membrane-bound lytic murein transglycosylase A